MTTRAKVTTGGNKRCRLSIQEDENDACLAAVVAILAERGFLGAKQTLILGQTSKELNQTCADNVVWAPLCHSKWPCTKSLPKEFLDQRSYLQLYRLWSAGIALSPHRHPLPPATCTAKDISLFVHVGYKGTSLIDLNVTGEEMLAPLLEHGEVEIELDRPVVLGTAEWAFTARHVKDFGDYHYGLPIQSQSRDWTAFNASIHCFRFTDSAMACLFQASKPGHCEYGPLGGGGVHPLIQKGEDISTSCQFDLSKPNIFTGLTFPDIVGEPRQVPPLQQSPMATEILSRMGQLVYFQLDVRLRVTEPNLVAIHAVKIKVTSDEYNEHGWDGSIFEGTKEVDRHGVSLLHILSELQATL